MLYCTEDQEHGAHTWCYPEWKEKIARICLSCGRKEKKEWTEGDLDDDQIRIVVLKKNNNINIGDTPFIFYG